VGVAVFWACWAVGVLGLFLVPSLTVVGVVAIVIGMAAGQFIFLNLYRVWEPETGRSAWQMMFVPRLRRDDLRAQWHVTVDPFRPAWIKHTLRATGWPVALVGYTLLGLLLVDLGLFAVLMSSDT